MTLSVLGLDTMVDPVLPLGTLEIMALAAVLARPSHGMLSREEDEYCDEGFDPDERAPDGGQPKVLPRQRDEFTCGGCFLVAHVSRRNVDGRCPDCK